jgi:hypothetical protein
MTIVAELHPSDNSDDDDDDENVGNSNNNSNNNASNSNGTTKKHKTDSSRDIPWPVVAQRLPTVRSAAECMKRYSKLTGQRQSEKTVALKGPWTASEDAKIIQLVTANGAKRWSQIAAELPGTLYVYLSIYRFDNNTAVQHHALCSTVGVVQSINRLLTLTLPIYSFNLFYVQVALESNVANGGTIT